MRISNFSLLFTMTLLDGSVLSTQTTSSNGTVLSWPLQTGFTTRDIISARDFVVWQGISLFETVHTGSWALPASYSMGIGFLSWG